MHGQSDLGAWQQKRSPLGQDGGVVARRESSSRTDTAGNARPEGHWLSSVQGIALNEHKVQDTQAG